MNRLYDYFTSMLRSLLIAWLCFGCVRIVCADAIVVTRAMSASTIAEVSVNDGSVGVDLEIGIRDLAAFADILPDDVYEKLTGNREPITLRQSRFFESGLVLKADDQQLVGRIEALEARKRVIRDVITGQPLAVQPQDAESVIHVALRYDFDVRPRTLSITPPGISDSHPASANVGFIVYHKALPVTDFRYLSTEETLDLNWDDPWYSRFHNINLKRRFDAPLSAFLYVENFEVRKEIVVRPRDLQQWIDLGIDGQRTLTVEEQPALKERVAEFLLKRNPVRIDGKPVTPILDRIHFIRRSLRTTGVIAPPEDLDLTAATLGVIIVYPIENLPQEVQMTWELFGDRIQQVPTVTTDEAGGLPYNVSPTDPVLKWQNFLTNPTVPAMISIAPLLQPLRWSVPVFSVAAFVIAVLLAAYAVRIRTRQPVLKPLMISGVVFVIGISCLPIGRATINNPLERMEPLSHSELEQLLGDLLHNTYRAFDRRDESLVYDRLAASISGDLLSDVYVQVRTSMELENQGGARVKVDDVELLSGTAVEQLENGGLVVRCNWLARGSVGHWGHIHQQANEYSALITVQPVDGAWKISQLDLIDEQRSVPNGSMSGQP
ncbi:MAG TPA: hypothetical protein EYG03_16820 [Planctomycetes bacterium]|nr:hypothetical protein [Fuerstiella sp.]HIK93613.1 hypothetical protein [Planctomycetota bacterium]